MIAFHSHQGADFVDRKMAFDAGLRHRVPRFKVLWFSLLGELVELEQGEGLLDVEGWLGLLLWSLQAPWITIHTVWELEAG